MRIYRLRPFCVLTYYSFLKNRAFGRLYKNNPRTAISNLHLLVEPVCPPVKKRKSAKAHGCWKDLLDILSLATLDEFSSPETFFHVPRMEFVHKRRKGTGRKTGTPDSRIEQSKVEGQERKVAAKKSPCRQAYSLPPSSCR